MLDIHCHLLPKIDDGPATMLESLKMSKAAVEQGISRIVCTPHHDNGIYQNPKNEVLKQVESFKLELCKMNIPLEIFAAQEIRVTNQLLTHLDNDNLLFIDEQKKFLLIEFPSLGVPINAKEIIFNLLCRDIVPILAHPERNSHFLKYPNSLVPFLEMGVYSQLSAASYLGGFGKKVKRLSKLLIENDAVHVIASDAHGIYKRVFQLQEAYAQIENDFGKTRADKLKHNSELIFRGIELAKPHIYTEIQKKSFFNMRVT
ncbi:tyrosine-protein phosphatase [Enterococcus faecium]